MANNTYRGGPGRYGRNRGYDYGQEEQFEGSYGYGERSLGQMGEGPGMHDQESSWLSDDDDDQSDRQRRYRAGRGYQSGASGRFGGMPSGGAGREDYNRHVGSDFQSGDRWRQRSGWSADASYGAGSRLAAAHGEWHDNDRDRHRGGYIGGHRAYGRGGDDRGFLERAGEAVANWFGGDDDDDYRSRQQQGYRGHGPTNYTRSDSRILEDACDRLTDDWRVDARNINVTVENGELTLNGTVTSRDQKRRAEDVVEDIGGVKHVQNNLRVQDSTTGQNDRTTPLA